MLSKLRRLISTYGFVDVLRMTVIRIFYWIYNVSLLRAMGVRVGKGVLFEGAVQVHGGSRVRIGDRVHFGAGVIIDAGSAGTVAIGARSYVGRFTTIIANSRVEIGEDCLISPFCYVIDSDHGFELNVPIRLQQYRIKPIKIGGDVWVGTGTAILKGVSIGSGAVLGAGSVLTKDVPSCSVAVGSPAKVIGRRARSTSL